MKRILTTDCFIGLAVTRPQNESWKELRGVLEHAAAFFEELPGHIFIAGFDQTPFFISFHRPSYTTYGKSSSQVA